MKLLKVFPITKLTQRCLNGGLQLGMASAYKNDKNMTYYIYGYKLDLGTVEGLQCGMGDA